MTVSQQYALDAYRAAQRGETVGPAPSLHDWAALRELRDHRRFEAVLAGRPARGRIRAALARRFSVLRGHTAGC
ncbi:hypothetical protein ACIREE_31480 [Streptomyces sp. NPDC102467]|uniref:hypothetical protein n=1 Tax=Streptomyces sp. NPDC102467 TaxID=3366179 RepID=UPI0037FB8905